MSGTLGERLVALREHSAGRRGQRRFAMMVGIKQQSISNYERGSIPSAEVVAKMVRSTGCSADWLLTGRGSMYPDGDHTAGDGTAGSAVMWRDASGSLQTPRSVALRLGMDEATAADVLESLAHALGGTPIPAVLVSDGGRTLALAPDPPSPAVARSRVTIEVTETEVQVGVPAEWLASRGVRVIPLPAGGSRR